jgi:hypothetical protein
MNQQNMQSHVGTGEAVLTLEEPESFNPIRIFTNPLNILSYLLEVKDHWAQCLGLKG